MSELKTKQEVAAYVKEHPLMVLGTVDEKGRPHGAAVYVYTASADWFYFVTKAQTIKFKNLLDNAFVSVTIADASDNSTLQGYGKAHVIEDAHIIEMVMSSLTEIYAKSVDWLPPISKLRAGVYQVVGIKMKHIRLGQFQNKVAGSPTIYTEVEL